MALLINSYNLTLNNNFKILCLFFIFICYFLIMDIKLYNTLQHHVPATFIHDGSKIVVQQPQQQQQQQSQGTINVFYPITPKLIMIDHTTHYVHDIVAQVMENVCHITAMFPWLTANCVSFFGLIMACIASKLVISDRLAYRRVGCLFFELRNFADSLDGVVYRSRARRNHTYESVKGTAGYNVDVYCDGLAGLVFMFAILFRYLRRQPYKSTMTILPNACNLLTLTQSKQNSDQLLQFDSINLTNKQINDDNDDGSSSSASSVLLLNLNDSNDNDVHEYDTSMSSSLNNDNNTRSTKYSLNNYNNNDNSSFVSYRQIKIIIVAFGFRLLFTGLIWDHFVNKYQILLQNYSENLIQRELQLKIFKSFNTWIILWFWRVGNGCAMLEHLVISTFLDKTWEYMLVTSVIGWLYLVILTLFTQIHYIEAAEALMKSIAFI